jgi:hypothetical protein
VLRHDSGSGKEEMGGHADNPDQNGEVKEKPMTYLYRNVKDLIEPLEQTHGCRICNNDRLPDDFHRCHVCGKYACDQCSHLYESGATVCKRCFEDSPDSVIEWFDAELVKANQIAAAKDKYIDNLRLVAKHVPDAGARGGVA